MGFISNMFGTHNDYQAGASNQSNPYTPEQLQQQYQFALANQRAQQGLQAQQGALGQQLLAQSQGQGPNPALDQLHQTTDANNQQATGMLASQRGLNPAIAAKLAADNQAQNNQRAAGEAATMRAQQMLGAQSQLGSLYGQQGQQLNQMQQGFNQSQQGINQANLGTQAINANVAGQNAQANGQAAGAGLGAIGSLGSFAGNMFKGGGGSTGSNIPVTAVEAQGGMIKPPVKMAEGGAVNNPYTDLVASMTGLSPAITGAGATKFAGGGSTGFGGNMKLGPAGQSTDALPASNPYSTAPGSNYQTQATANRANIQAAHPGMMDYSGLNQQQAQQAALNHDRSLSAAWAAQNLQPQGWYNNALNDFGNSPITNALGKASLYGSAAVLGGAAGLGALSGPATSTVINGAQANASGGKIEAGSKLKKGGKVPGKAKVEGNSYANDNVKALLSPGEIVIPRSVTQSDDPVRNAAAFVQAVMAKQGLKGGKR